MSQPFQETIKGWNDLAEKVLEMARKRGLEAMLRLETSRRLKVRVRLGKLDELSQTAPQNSVLKVFKGNRSVSGSTSKLTVEGLVALLDRLNQHVELVDEDKAVGLPEPEWLVKKVPDLKLFDPAFLDFPVEKAKRMALEAEKAALDFDKRVTNSSGAGVGTSVYAACLYNTSGLKACEWGSSGSISVSPVAENEKGEKSSDSWFTWQRFEDSLEAPMTVGEMAAKRAVDGLGAGTAPTGKVPVLFAPETATALLGHLWECAAGDRVYKGSTYLTKAEKKAVASKLVTVVDDPLIPKGLNSTAFDGEGVATRRRILVKDGVLQFHPCDCYSARKLNRESTGHRSGGGVGSYNLYLENGEESPEQLLKKMGTGLFVTAFIGFGFNHATGDFSRGVRGFWVEEGKVVRPIQEVTVSGNLDEMLKNVVAVGNDLCFRYGTDSPSLLVSEMTVSGS